MQGNVRLYRHPLSGHAHRAQLLLSLLGVETTLVDVDLMKGAHKQPEFLRMNRFGQVPVLDDHGVVIADSNAILVYLARKFGRSDWYPVDALGYWFFAPDQATGRPLRKARASRTKPEP